MAKRSKQAAKRHRKAVARPEPLSAPLSGMSEAQALAIRAAFAADYRHVWRTLLTAVDTSPQDVGSIVGASGLRHHVVAAGVDDTRKRTVIVSAQPDADTAALVQVDLQAALRGSKVILVRPVMADFQAFALSVISELGVDQLELTWNQEDAQQPSAQRTLFKLLGPLLRGVANSAASGSLDWSTVLRTLVSQGQLIDWGHGEGPEARTVSLSRMAALSPLEADRSVGICGVPMYAFHGDELESLNSGSDRDRVEEILRRHGLLQYFFPAPDQVALGLVDRATASISPEAITAELHIAPRLGHPFGPMDIVPAGTRLRETVAALVDMGLVVAGAECSTTDDGDAIRATVRLQPREGLISRLINRINFNFNLGP